MKTILLGNQAFFFYSVIGAIIIIAASFLRRTRDKYPDF
jgi:hypothetical protein